MKDRQRLMRQCKILAQTECADYREYPEGGYCMPDDKPCQFWRNGKPCDRLEDCVLRAHPEMLREIAAADQCTTRRARCAMCKKEFTPTSSAEKYCSDSCRALKKNQDAAARMRKARIAQSAQSPKCSQIGFQTR